MCVRAHARGIVCEVIQEAYGTQHARVMQEGHSTRARTGGCGDGEDDDYDDDDDEEDYDEMDEENDDEDDEHSDRNPYLSFLKTILNPDSPFARK